MQHTIPTKVKYILVILPTWQVHKNSSLRDLFLKSLPCACCWVGKGAKPNLAKCPSKNCTKVPASCTIHRRYSIHLAQLPRVGLVYWNLSVRFGGSLLSAKDCRTKLCLSTRTLHKHLIVPIHRTRSHNTQYFVSWNPSLQAAAEECANTKFRLYY